ncbi:MAG: DUF1822 family protein [Hormoscilla sp.]
MAVSLRASKQGLEIVDLARRKKGWTKTADVWCHDARVGKAGLRRFWRRMPILQENFVSICQTVGVKWEEIFDSTQKREENSQSQTSSETLWLLELKATIDEVDKPLIDSLIAEVQQRSPDAIVKTQKLDITSAVLVQDWQSVESVLPSGKRRSRHLAIAPPEGSVRRAKPIDLGANRSAVLVVEMTPVSPEEVHVEVEVYPAGDDRYLYPGLQLAAIDESEAVILENKAGIAADSMQLKIEIEPGEMFSIRVTLGDVIITEDL